MSEFDGPPLKVIARRTDRADRDFADWRIGDDRQDRIARSLKAVPYSKDDRVFGDVRLREIIEGFDVAFVLGQEPGAFVVLIIGFDRTGEMESQLARLVRAGSEVVPPLKAGMTLLESRKRKS